MTKDKKQIGFQVGKQEEVNSSESVEKTTNNPHQGNLYYEISLYDVNDPTSRKSEGNYFKGRKEGEWLFYDKDGKLESKENYKDGILDGLKITYYCEHCAEICKDSGTKEEFYKNGKVIELCEYDCSRDICNKGKYINGIKEGKWIEGYESGVYKKGLKEGKWVYDAIEEFHTGNVHHLESGSYKKGKLSGEWKKTVQVIDSNGDPIYTLTQKTHYKNGKLEGLLLKKEEIFIDLYDDFLDFEIQNSESDDTPWYGYEFPESLGYRTTEIIGKITYKNDKSSEGEIKVKYFNEDGECIKENSFKDYYEFELARRSKEQSEPDKSWFDKLKDFFN